MPEQDKHLQLRDKVVLVTGASRGIGAAAAKRLAVSGASVIINYHRNREAAKKVLDEIQSAGGEGMVFQADVRRKDQVDLMIKGVREHYRAIDVLVNNAYFPFQVGQLHELSWEDFHRAIEHELMAFHNCVQACLPDMTEKKSGKIIVVSTRLAQQPLAKIGARIDG
jgi:3-oxoacyl-[acyl-carrier protein] reductase